MNERQERLKAAAKAREELRNAVHMQLKDDLKLDRDEINALVKEIVVEQVKKSLTDARLERLLKEVIAEHARVNKSWVDSLVRDDLMKASKEEAARIVGKQLVVKVDVLQGGEWS